MWYKIHWERMDRKLDRSGNVSEQKPGVFANRVGLVELDGKSFKVGGKRSGRDGGISYD